MSLTLNLCVDVIDTIPIDIGQYWPLSTGKCTAGYWGRSQAPQRGWLGQRQRHGPIRGERTTLRSYPVCRSGNTKTPSFECVCAPAKLASLTGAKRALTMLLLMRVRARKAAQPPRRLTGPQGHTVCERARHLESRHTTEREVVQRLRRARSAAVRHSNQASVLGRVQATNVVTDDLARESGVNRRTILSFENDERAAFSTIAKLRETFEREGVVFIERGVHLGGVGPLWRGTS